VGKAAMSSKLKDVMGGMCSTHKEVSEHTCNILAAKPIRHMLLRGPGHKREDNIKKKD
jgi:hypothetical protein